jgi:lysophospholipase L1-like esterase
VATTVAAGRSALTDPVHLPTRPLDRLTVTLYFAEPTGPATFHESAATTTYRSAGDHRWDTGGSAYGETTKSWYYLTGVDVSGAPRRDAVVAFGDSITDSGGSTRGADNRYPDELAERLVAAGVPLAVLNAGLSGNRVLNDSPCFGESALDRFQRDVLDQVGVRTVIVMEGVNDLGYPTWDFPCFEPNDEFVTAQQLIEGYRALIRAAHAHGIRIIGGTVTPLGFFRTPDTEPVRIAVNEWIRTSGEYDAVVDFARIVADPKDPSLLLSDYDPGDGLHPNDLGLKAMADAIDLATL